MAVLLGPVQSALTNLLPPERDRFLTGPLAERAMTVRVCGLGLSVEYSRGEQMRTEVSATFRPDRLGALFAASGFALTRMWTDPDRRHALPLATAA
jgi:uncharacterized SAM-dependent methyltransferase